MIVDEEQAHLRLLGACTQYSSWNSGMLHLHNYTSAQAGDVVVRADCQTMPLAHGQSMHMQVVRVCEYG